MQQDMRGVTNKTSTRASDSLPEMEADRAIQLVRRKLSSRLSVEADVRRLILEATDEGNLSRMYSGIAHAQFLFLASLISGWAAFA
jgi:phosphatidylinositol kinase/protein kinase (PI-3  family)